MEVFCAKLSPSSDSFYPGCGPDVTEEVPWQVQILSSHKHVIFKCTLES